MLFQILLYTEFVLLPLPCLFLNAYVYIFTLSVLRVVLLVMSTFHCALMENKVCLNLNLK